MQSSGESIGIAEERAPWPEYDDDRSEQEGIVSTHVGKRRGTGRAYRNLQGQASFTATV
jgi:hypothetical protein